MNKLKVLLLCACTIYTLYARRYNEVIPIIISEQGSFMVGVVLLHIRGTIRILAIRKADITR